MPRAAPVKVKQEPHVRMVKHLDKFYFVVFKDSTIEFVTDVWVRDFKAEHNRTCIWSHMWKKVPTQRVKDIAFKAMTAPLGQ